MALKLTLILCVVAIWAVDYAQCASPKQAPAPAVDCSSLILNMADCLSFVQNGSTVTKPEGTCCAGLKSVLKADAGCLCEAFKSSAQLGVVLNVTKASTLPTACKVSAPSISNCELSTSPAGAPGLSPESAPTTAAAPEVGAPEQGAGANEQAPAPAPGSSGSSMLSATIGSLLIALVIASSSWF